MKLRKRNARAYRFDAMSSRSLYLTLAAEADLRSIQRYTLRMWGETGRDQYASNLVAQMHRLVDFPDLGPLVDHDSFPGVRRLVAAQHAIVYVADDDTVSILRILHKRQVLSR